MTEVLLLVALTALISAGLTWLWIQRRLRQDARRQRLDQQGRLQSLIESTTGPTGDNFFYALARELAVYLGVDSVVICERLQDDDDAYRSLAHWVDGRYIMNHRLSLAHCPCDEQGNFWHIASGVADLFPEAALLRDPFCASGFFSIRLEDRSGNPIGAIAGMHRHEFGPEKHDSGVIRMFADRAASELERKIAQGLSLVEKERAQITLHSLGDCIITTDAQGCIDYMNPVAEKLTGWRFHQAMGLSVEAVVHLEDETSGVPISDPALRCLSEQRVISPKSDNVLISRSGERYSILGTAAPMIDSQGQVIGVALVVKDVTDSRHVQRMIVHQATHDALTGLVNRIEFEKRLETALLSAKNFENTHALLFLDLDQFKQVNDNAGHAAGDELLRQISVLLAGQLRGRDTLGRMGGDEFSVLLENCPRSKAHKVAEMLIDAVREYRFAWEQKTFQVGVSIGIVPVNAESGSTKELMHEADLACYAAKDLGRGRACMRTPTGDDAPLSLRSEKLQRKDIDQALDEENFLLLYQPIVALDPAQAEQRTRVEVLLRMIDRDGAVISPGAFLPSATRFGLMQQIDRWVIERVFKGHPHLFVQNPELVMSLNLSGASVADETLADFIERQFQQTVVRPEQICFEITEQVLSHNLVNAGRLITRLRKLGASFALDDFGSGLASFATLKDLPMDFVKIDGDLVRDICNDEVDRTMVESINSMAHLLGIRTIAERVDNEASLSGLKALGVDFAQGFHLCDLLPLEEIEVGPEARGLPATHVN